MKLVQHRPGGSELDRIQVRAGRLEKGFQTLCRKIEAMLLPTQPGILAEVVRSGGDVLHRLGFGPNVAESQDQRPDARLHDRSHGLQAGCKVWKTIAATDDGFGQMMNAQDCSEDNAERALGADPELMKRRAGRRSRSGPWRREGPIGQNNRESEHQILYAAVAARLLPGRARRDESAKGRARE